MTTLPVIDVDAFFLSKSTACKELYFPRKILKAEVGVSTHRYFIVVVVVVDDDTYNWVYLSSYHLFQVYCKVRQPFLLQSAMVCYYKVRQVFYYKVRQVLQSVTILLQSPTGITKCDDYYKVRQYTRSLLGGREH